MLDPELDPLLTKQIRIRIKMKQIRNTALIWILFSGEAFRLITDRGYLYSG